MGALSVLENNMSLLEVKNLKVHFPVKAGFSLRRSGLATQAGFSAAAEFCRIDALPHWA